MTLSALENLIEIVISISLFSLCYIWSISFFLLQFQVRAFDDGKPGKTTDVACIVNVAWDKNDPVYENTPYTQTITENVNTGFSVLSVSATDADLSVSTYTYKSKNTFFMWLCSNWLRAVFFLYIYNMKTIWYQLTTHVLRICLWQQWNIIEVWGY